MIDRLCNKCGEQPGEVFTAVGSDPNRFTWSKFEYWCRQCIQARHDEFDARFNERREQREREKKENYRKWLGYD